MDKKRQVITTFGHDTRWYNLNLSAQKIYIGNKIVKAKHRGEIFWDISLIKEVFYKDEGKIESLTDFSNFHHLWNGVDLEKKDFSKPNEIVVPYKEFHLETEIIRLEDRIERAKNYTVFLKSIAMYLGENAKPIDVLTFVNNWNKKLLPLVIKEIERQGLQIIDWWYTEEFMKDEHSIEVVSTRDENLLDTLAVVSGNIYDYEKIAKPIKAIKKLHP